MATSSFKIIWKTELGHWGRYEKNSQITFVGAGVWLLKTPEWRTRTSKFPVQLHWARAHECNSGLPDDRWSQSSEDKQMFWETWSDQQQRPNTSPCSKTEQKRDGWKTNRKRKVEEMGGIKGGRKQRRDIKRRTSKGRECRRKWEWATQWGAGERGERKEKELREGEGECFYPHVHSVKGVSECDCSWTACQNSAAATAAINLRPSLKCTRAQTHTNTLTYTCANAYRVSKSF